MINYFSTKKFQPNFLIKLIMVNGFLIIFLTLFGCASNDTTINEMEEDTPENQLSLEPKPGIQEIFLKGTTKSSYGFHLYTPTAYDHSNSTEEFPLLIFLHGGGARGDGTTSNSLSSILYDGPPHLIDKGEWSPKHPMIVASPQSFSFWNSENLHEFIGFLIENLNVDIERIYMTGFSMGGRGSFDYIADRGDSSYVAAIVPIAGWGNISAGKQFQNTPVWAFHGDADNVVSISGSIDMVNSINMETPIIPAKLTIYPDVDHNSWTRTYNGSGMGEESGASATFNMSIYEWMYQYTKN